MVAPFVLIVDDEPNIRQLLSNFLGYEGYVVEAAEDGQAALEVIERAVPTLILLDLNMPVLDGWGFLQELDRRGLRLPVVIMTAGLAGRETAEKYGAIGYLGKPFDLDDLLATIHHIWEPERQVSSYCTGSANYSLSAG